MSVLEVEVDRNSDSEHFYTCSVVYLCLPTSLVTAQPMVVVRKSISGYKKAGKMHYHDPAIEMLTEKPGAFTPEQRAEIKSLVELIIDGPECSDLTLLRELIRSNYHQHSLNSVYGETPTGKAFVSDLVALAAKYEERCQEALEKARQRHRYAKERELKKLLCYPSAWQEM